jgi:hypothetical protein
LKKEQDGRESVSRLKPKVDCNASKTRRRRRRRMKKKIRRKEEEVSVSLRYL